MVSYTVKNRPVSGAAGCQGWGYRLPESSVDLLPKPTCAPLNEMPPLSPATPGNAGPGTGFVAATGLAAKLAGEIGDCQLKSLIL